MEDAFNRQQANSDYIFSRFVYQWRWVTTILVLGLIFWGFATGIGKVGSVTGAVTKIGDISAGSGVIDPQVFDPSLDVWFDTGDEVVNTFYDIEDRFVAEDFIMVSYENKESEFGAFSQESLATIARLTERFLSIPGVRHVRSLTYSPWIRWGEVDGEYGREGSLIISDYVENNPLALTDFGVIERMVAVLGAERTAQKVGEDKVRQVIGYSADFSNYIGEPLLLDTIVDEEANTTAIQVQVIRPNVDKERLSNLTGVTDPEKLDLIANLYSVQYQRAALRGIEHFIRLEQGLAQKTPEYAKLQAWIDAMPAGEEKERLLLQLQDPTKNFMKDETGVLVRKYFEYDLQADGRYVDMSDPANPVVAAADFSPNDAKLSRFDFRTAGIPIFERNFEITGKSDGVYLPLMFLVVAVSLFILFRFRSVMGVITPMLVIIVSIIGTVGCIFLFGNLFNNMTAMTPNMMTAIAVADSIHLIAAWLILQRKMDDKQSLIIEVIRKNALPVFLTSVTTAVGFCALTVSELQPVRQLGVAMAIGTILAYLLSMTLVPAILSLVPHKAAKTNSRGLVNLFTEERAEKMAAFVASHRKSIVTFAAVFTVVGLIGASMVSINADIRNMFPDDNKVIMDVTWIEDRLGGTGDLEIVFNGVEANPGVQALTKSESLRLAQLRLRQTAVDGGVQEFSQLSSAERRELVSLKQKQLAWEASRIGVNAEFLQQVEQFEAQLKKEMATQTSPLRHITDLASPLDILRKIHQVQNRNEADYYRVINDGDVAGSSRNESIQYDEFTEEWEYIPAQTASSLAAQYYLQYESGARPGENLATQLSNDRRYFRMQGRVTLVSSNDKEAMYERIDEIVAKNFPALAVKAGGESAISNMVISGKKALMDRTGLIITKGYVESITIALIVISILIGLFFRSIKLALVSLLPNVLPIVLPLSFFGLFGRMLDGPAVVVSSVAIGVCVDDTIHFFSKYRDAMRQGKSSQQAIAYVLQECGSALTITTIVLVIGFATLLLSSFSPNVLMGVLATAMIAFAWIADLIVTPAVLMLSDATEEEEGQPDIGEQDSDLTAVVTASVGTTQ